MPCANARCRVLPRDGCCGDCDSSGDGTLRKAHRNTPPWSLQPALELHATQLRLLKQALRQLGRDGVCVYSTCSFARAQNEDVVAALLAAEPSARLAPIERLAGAPCSPGALPHTLRFEPRISRSSGLFVARVEKVAGSVGSGRRAVERS